MKIKNKKELELLPIIYMEYIPYNMVKEMAKQVICHFQKNRKKLLEEDHGALFCYMGRLMNIIERYSLNNVEKSISKQRDRFLSKCYKRLSNNKFYKDMCVIDTQNVQLEDTFFGAWKGHFLKNYTRENIRRYKNLLKKQMLEWDYPFQVQENAMAAFNLELEKIKQEAISALYR